MQLYSGAGGLSSQANFSPRSPPASATHTSNHRERAQASMTQKQKLLRPEPLGGQAGGWAGPPSHAQHPRGGLQGEQVPGRCVPVPAPGPGPVRPLICPGSVTWATYGPAGSPFPEPIQPRPRTPEGTVSIHSHKESKVTRVTTYRSQKWGWGSIMRGGRGKGSPCPRSPARRTRGEQGGSLRDLEGVWGGGNWLFSASTLKCPGESRAPGKAEREPGAES